MTLFHSASSEKFDLSKGPLTLVMPSLSIGNVGQLAIDLFISTFDLPLVGRLESPFVVPVVGNDAFTQGEGRIATSIDLHFYREKNVLVLQQRAPVLEGKHNAFAESFVAWVKSTSVNQILFLTSTDAAFRFAESQLSGSQLRYLSFPGRQSEKNHFASLAKSLNWKEVEDESVAEVLKRGTVSQKLYTACRQNDVPIFVVTLFCAEGNNIPEGTAMAGLLSALLETKEEPQWKFPPSWNAMLTPTPLETSLFM
jgi:proteasome assembly chaperone 2